LALKLEVDFYLCFFMDVFEDYKQGVVLFWFNFFAFNFSTQFCLVPSLCYFDTVNDVFMEPNKKKDYLPRILLALVYILVSFHFRYPEVFPGKNIILTSHPFFGFLLLWFYSLKLSFKKNRKK